MSDARPMDQSLTAGALRFTPPKFGSAEAVRILEARYGVAGSVQPLIGERDQNFHVTTPDGREFVLKISSPDEPAELVDFQVQAFAHIAKGPPGIDVPRHVPTVDREPACTHTDDRGVGHAVRLLTYLPGVPLTLDPAPSLATFGRVGALQARLCVALQGFRHPAAARFMPWDTMNRLALSPGLRRGHLPAHLAESCEAALRRIGEHLLPALAKQPAQVIHNDVHARNLLCDAEDPERVTGILDFGDMVERPLVIDLATSVASIAQHAPDPLVAAVAMARGFEAELALPDGQLECLPDAILLRAILTCQLVSFQIAVGNNPGELRERVLPASLAALECWLAADRDRFLDLLAGGDSTGAGRNQPS